MSDFSNYAEQGLQPGRTVPYEVTELVNADGSHPVLHIEHLGEANESLLEERIARARAHKADAPDEAPGPVEVRRLNIEAVVKHAAKRLENAFKSDGSAATDADIPAFIRAMSVKAFTRLFLYVTDEQHFCTFPIAEKPQALAEK